MGSDKKLANVVGARTARACDNCVKNRARWYCASDDAFLCQACDNSVHSANSLARRHERVRLKTNSFAKSDENTENNSNHDSLQSPTWHRGFKKKARTPRHHHGKSKSDESVRDTLLQNLVPEIQSEGMMTWQEENEEQLLYRVPVFVSESCLTGNSNDLTAVSPRDKEPRNSFANENVNVSHDIVDNSLGDELVASDVDLAQFAADMECLLGKSLDDEALDIVGLGIIECKVEEGEYSYGRVKIEDKDGDDVEADMAPDDTAREPFEFNFDFDSPSICCEEDEKDGAIHIDDIEERNKNNEYDQEASKKVLLSLDYEGVMAAWDERRCPWITGDRPDELDGSDCWPEFNMDGGSVEYCDVYGPDEMMGVNNTNGETSGTIILDEGREARVSRYREKRRKRLYSKKIRYEVRKLNAEKRPRMKGRFVKRPN